MSRGTIITTVDMTPDTPRGETGVCYYKDQRLQEGSKFTCNLRIQNKVTTGLAIYLRGNCVSVFACTVCMFVYEGGPASFVPRRLITPSDINP